MPRKLASEAPREERRAPDREAVAKIRHETHNEQVLIAASIVDPPTRTRLVKILPADGFYGKGHAAAWAAICELERRGLQYDPATVAEISNGAVDTATLDALVALRPTVPANLAFHVEAFLWDRRRLEAARGPLSALVEALQDPASEPAKLRALTKALDGAFAGSSSLRYLRDPGAVTASAKAQVAQRRERFASGLVCFPYGIPGLDRREDGTPRLVPGMAPAQMTLIAGVSGCLAGDTIVELNRAGKSFKLRLSEVVRRFNGGIAAGKVWDPRIDTRIRMRTPDGYIRLGRLVGAIESGSKLTFEITTAEGKKLRATEDHRLLTEFGWKRLGEVGIGDRLWCDAGPPRRTGYRGPKPQYRSLFRLFGHPYATSLGAKKARSRFSVPEHRVIVEASLNGISIETFVKRLRSRDVDGLKFLGSSAVVHHIDGNTRNNVLTNLEVLTSATHARRHGEEGWWKQVTAGTRLERVIAVVQHNVEPTFDLSVAEEPHCFLANGVVVHNSGKTTVTNQIVLARANAGERVLHGAWEQDGETNLQMLAGYSLRLPRTRLWIGDLSDAETTALEVEMDRLGGGERPLVRFFELPFDRKRGDRDRRPRSLNDEHLDAIHEHVELSGCSVAVFDLLAKALVETRPDEEKRALDRLLGIAVETNTHLVALHHLNKGDLDKRADRAPTREAIKGGTHWIDAFDTILATHIPGVWKDVPKDTLEIRVLKQRYGEWPLAVEFRYDAATGIISGGEEIPYEQPDEPRWGGPDPFLGPGEPEHKPAKRGGRR